MKKTIVLALGGNALLKKREARTFDEQMSNAEKTAKGLASVIAKSSSRFIVTHGNGPQVGDELLRNLHAQKDVKKLPMHILNAETQAFIGSMLELALNRELEKLGSKKRFVTIITHVVVDEKDKAFKTPSKPVGPYYTKEGLDKELKNTRFSFVKVNGGYRRVVASPKPLEILEINSIKSLLDDGYCIICCGGGGIPVFKKGKTYTGADAVIDKDSTTQLLAQRLGANELDILTDVDYVYRDFNDKNSKINKISSKALAKELTKFEAGSMQPKIKACTDFLKNGGGVAKIGNLYKATDVINGKHCTIIVK